MSFNGVRLFRYALLAEIGANISSIIPMLLAPETVLTYLVKGPNHITPATKSLTQWFASHTSPNLSCPSHPSPPLSNTPHPTGSAPSSSPSQSPSPSPTPTPPQAKAATPRSWPGAA